LTGLMTQRRFSKGVYLYGAFPFCVLEVNMKCKDCLYSEKLVQKQKEGKEDLTQTICRNNAPSLEPRVWAIGDFINGHNYAYTSFPFIDIDKDWCGDFKEKK
jgi:hypothetical protein